MCNELVMLIDNSKIFFEISDSKKLEATIQPFSNLIVEISCQ